MYRLDRAALLAADPRLAATVSVDGTFRLGEVLEDISTQTGVTLSAGDRDGAAGKWVTLYVHDYPLVHLIISLWSLFSYQKAEWRWERVTPTKDASAKDSDVAAPRYLLTRPRNARYLAQQARDDLERYLEQDIAAKIALLELSPEKLREAAKTDRRAAQMQDALLQGGISAFAAVLSPEERLAVIRGKEVNLPLGRLPEAAKQHIQHLYEQSVKMSPENKPEPRPTHLNIHRSESGSLLVPAVIVAMGQENGALGFGISGEQEDQNQYRQQLTDRWVLENDDRHSRAEEAKMLPRVKPPKKVDPKTIAQLQERGIPAEVAYQAKADFRTRLRDIHTELGIPVIARFGPGLLSLGAEPLSVGEFLRRSCEGNCAADQIFKWRNNSLLVSYPTAIMDEDDEVPWSTLKWLRQARQQSEDGLLSVDDVCQAVKELTPAQLRMLGYESGFAGFEEFAKYHELVTFLAEPELRARLSSPEGVAFQRLPRAMRPLILALAEQSPAEAEKIVLSPQEQRTGRLALQLREQPADIATHQPANRTLLIRWLSSGAPAPARPKLLVGFGWSGILPNKVP